MRLVKIPYDHGDDRDIPAKVRRAERRFLESLKTEAKRSVEPRGRLRAAKTPLRPGRASSAAGRGLGAAYAALNGNGQDYRRAESFASAIKSGLDDVARRDAVEAELTRDPEFLKDMGFHGFGPQRDDDF